MEYAPLPNPIPDDIAADLCDPGNPPEGYVRVVLTKTGMTPPLVSIPRPDLPGDIASLYFEEGVEPVEYKFDFILRSSFDTMPEWSP